MKKLLLILASLLLVSCHEKHKIEIYLLKERVLNKHGISVWDHKEYGKNLRSNHEDETGSYQYVTLDTLTNELIWADTFDAPPKDRWQDKPFISDSEIMLLDTIKGRVRISQSGMKKIAALRDNYQGIQFIITDNSKPVMTGYFWRYWSKTTSNADNIMYTGSFDSLAKHHDLLMLNSHWKPSYDKKTAFKKYPHLIAAFKESDRLKE